MIIEIISAVELHHPGHLKDAIKKANINDGNKFIREIKMYIVDNWEHDKINKFTQVLDEWYENKSASDFAETQNQFNFLNDVIENIGF